MNDAGTDGAAVDHAADSRAADAPEPRVIKRYANRKLYDMSESCYVTHDEIAELVKGGVEVRIVDNRTKEDLTTLTLTQILFKEEKKQRRTLPLHTLRGILQSGGDFIQKHITDPVSKARDEAGETVRSTITNVFRREDELDDGERPVTTEGADIAAATPAPRASDDSTPATPTTSEVVDESGRPVEGMREWLDTTQLSFETLQRTLEDRWRLITNSLGTLDANRKRIRDLEELVRTLETRLAALEPPTGDAGAESDGPTGEDT